jgi:putative transposase
MPRTAHSSVGGYCYHVLNRGNGRATVFHKPQDYLAFLALIAEAGLRHPMRLLAYCVSRVGDWRGKQLILGFLDP